MLPFHIDRYEMRIGVQGEKLLLDSNQESVLQNTDLMRTFLERTRGKLFVSVRADRENQLVRSGQDPVYREVDAVMMIGIGRFAETPEDMDDILLQSFAVAEAVNPTDDGSEFRSVAFPSGDPKAVPLSELFLVSSEASLGNRYFLYVGDAAQVFLGEVISFFQVRWGVHPMTALRLLSRCELTDVLLENKEAQAYLAFVAGQVGEELYSCGKKISGLEGQLSPLRRQADALVEDARFLLRFIPK